MARCAGDVIMLLGAVFFFAVSSGVSAPRGGRTPFWTEARALGETLLSESKAFW